MAGCRIRRLTRRFQPARRQRQRRAAEAGSLGGPTHVRTMWNIEWTALSARIAALLEAGTYFVRTVGTGESDNYGLTDELLRNAKETVDRIKIFESNHGCQIPESAREALIRFLTQYNAHFPNMSGGLPATQGALTLLASFRGEFDYLVNDAEAVGRSLVARAFAHLQRSIVADDVVRQRWQTAFDEGETAVEKLGGVQLLLHGVWAFKASATGERTDLVLGIPLAVTNEVRRAANTLALTEWKVVNDNSELESKRNQALEQARRYSSGILAGFELSSRRYLVIVSGDFLTLPSPSRENSAVYEYLNVAISPTVPSKA